MRKATSTGIAFAAAAFVLGGALGTASDRRAEGRAAGGDRATAVRVAHALLARPLDLQLTRVRCERVAAAGFCGLTLSGVKFHRRVDTPAFRAEVDELVRGAFAVDPAIAEVDLWVTVPADAGKGAVVSGDFAQPSSATVFATTVPRAQTQRPSAGENVFWDPGLSQRDRRGVGRMISESRLPGGVRLLTELMPHVRSATLGIFAEVGSAEEPPAQRGISHLLEHMLFKGTPRRSARRIAEEMDGVGGNLNAATDKELTVFYAHVMDKHLPVAVDVLSDMFLHSVLDAEELRKERDVVLEEIKMYDDSPEDVINDAFARTLWRGANLGDPTIGFAQTVAAIDRETLAAWHRERYGPGTVLIAAAGNLDHDELAQRLGEAFAGFSGSAVAPEPERPVFHETVAITHDETEQAYILVGMPGLSMRDERRYTLSVLDTILGGGMSSRLFQEVREERGLAYEVSSFQQAYRSAGLFGVSAGTSPERVQECVDVIVAEIDRLVEGGVTEAEVARAREHLKGNMTLALESTSSRMSRLARNAIVHGRQISAEEVEDRFDAVDTAAVNALARELFATERGLCVLGPLAPDAVRLRRPHAV